MTAALAFAACVVGVNAAVLALSAGSGEGSAMIWRVGVPYALCAGVAAGVVGALTGPALVRAPSALRAALGGAGVVAGAAALYGVVWAALHLGLDVLPFGLPLEDREPVESVAGGFLGLLEMVLGYGLVLVVSASVTLVTLGAAPAGAGAGWWLWSRARRETPGPPQENP